MSVNLTVFFSFQIPDLYTGKKQYLKVTKKLVKNSIFEDIDFEVPKRTRKTKSEVSIQQSFVYKVLLLKLIFGGLEEMASDFKIILQS